MAEQPGQASHSALGSRFCLISPYRFPVAARLSPTHLVQMSTTDPTLRPFVPVWLRILGDVDHARPRLIHSGIDWPCFHYAFP